MRSSGSTRGRRAAARFSVAAGSSTSRPPRSSSCNSLSKRVAFVYREGTLDSVAADQRWLLDDPPAADWFSQALDLWSNRDPFDRLLVAHARLRGWRLATGDSSLLERLTPAERLEL